MATYVRADGRNRWWSRHDFSTIAHVNVSRSQYDQWCIASILITVIYLFFVVIVRHIDDIDEIERFTLEFSRHGYVWNTLEFSENNSINRKARSYPEATSVDCSGQPGMVHREKWTHMDEIH